MYINYPAKASKNAIEGYILNLDKKTCKNATGVQTAKRLINRVPISEKFVKKIYSYLKRAKVYVGEKNRCGYISYQLWGGSEMLNWCEKTLKK
ncbi:MAG: hypothetical protein ACO3BD_08415, partial [Chitinophagaceae bacterium]